MTVTCRHTHTLTHACTYTNTYAHSLARTHTHVNRHAHTHCTMFHLEMTLKGSRYLKGHTVGVGLAVIELSGNPSIVAVVFLKYFFLFLWNI